jgi:iron-sulfur cluster repair protein YtfE (RIC family)
MTHPEPLPGLEPTLSVNDVLHRWPIAAHTLNAWGIDTCCGGLLPLDAAAQEAGIDVDELITAITISATAAAPSGAERT